MRVASALLFVINLAVWVWMRTWPQSDGRAAHALAVDSNGNIGALELQVRVARGYVVSLEYVTFSSMIVGFLVLTNPAAFLYLATRLTARKQA